MVGDQRYAVCLTFDIDAMCVWLGGPQFRVSPAMLYRGEYGPRVGVPRILELLSEYGLPATFFVPGHTAESFPGVVDSILAAGHEIGHHSYSHEDPSTQAPDQERRDMDRALRALERFLGRPPLGYRSPSFDYSEVTLSLLVEYGLLYDSSLFAEDFHPYHPRLGDHVAKEQPLQMGTEVGIWELPLDLSLSDWPHFTFNFDPLRVGLSAPSKVLEIWEGDFHYLVEHEQTGVFTVCMHPQVIARGHRMWMLERFIQHTLNQPAARFARLGDVAQELAAGAVF